MKHPQRHRQIMSAPDMFLEQIFQTFDRKTGERISFGTIPEDPDKVEDDYYTSRPVDTNQLNLFP